LKIGPQISNLDRIVNEAKEAVMNTFANQADTDREIQIYTERYNIRHYQTHSRRPGTANY